MPINSTARTIPRAIPRAIPQPISPPGPFSAVHLRRQSTSSQGQPPLAVLPTGALLRSLLTNCVASKPWLQRPVLAVLARLAAIDSGNWFSVDRNPLLHAVLKTTFYRQFCAGETPSETRETLRALKAMGFGGSILTYARETVFDHRTGAQRAFTDGNRVDDDEHIAVWRRGTLDTVDLLGPNDLLALKLTGAGPGVTGAFAAGENPPAAMWAAVEAICDRCEERNVRILVDAESQHYQAGIQKMTLELMRKYNRNRPALVYNTYQAYLKATPATLATHLVAAAQDGFTLGLKLVRGAYLATDPRALIHDTKADTDAAYNAIAQGALRRHLGDFGGDNALKPFPAVDLFLAGHNRVSVMTAYELHRSRRLAGLPTVRLGFAQLHGMSDELSFDLLQRTRGNFNEKPGLDFQEPDVYKCSNWGTVGECLAYLTRRAIENRDAITRTHDEYSALKAEARRRILAGWQPSPRRGKVWDI
ncbi:hypothetical protein ASPZODRAFT_20636 [Penicilliopsis zonata CBS 506.65]|uniref:Proline dehydrogenase n=1 Tax=Penicilliopsis zonata CBS 506.65 TaxID=1073090 RepID=A0A1L9S565_9EURO|nr:hypothetical protein ASPZODRAFT_20636 [Penicilliopsis zonata CBS 506.65]OJJ42313.1 hypothetical protein ASPZODRAFT_20636 [Penicilliopsis zonata CBS 506.65]